MPPAYTVMTVTMYAHIICIVLLQVIYSEILFRHVLDEYPSAVCLDGSPAGYFHTWQDPWDMAENPSPNYYIYPRWTSMKKWQKRCPNPFSCVDEATCEYLCYKHPVSCSGPDEFMFHMNDDFTMGSVDRNHRSVVEKVYNVWVPELNFHKRNQMKRIHPRGKH